MTNVSFILRADNETQIRYIRMTKLMRRLLTEEVLEILNKITTDMQLVVTAVTVGMMVGSDDQCRPITNYAFETIWFHLADLLIGDYCSQKRPE